MFTFEHFDWNEIGSRVIFPVGSSRGKIIVIGKLYFVRQAATLLKFAKSTANPELSAVLIEKAVELKSRVDGEAERRIESLRAPDVEPEAGSRFGARPVGHHERGPYTGVPGYDRGSGENCRDVISFAGRLTIRVQTLPEQ